MGGHEEFYAIAYPCRDVAVARVALTVVQSGVTEPDKSMVMEVILEPPVPARELLVPLDPKAQVEGQTKTVLDAQELDRFLHDVDYLTSVRDPFYFDLELFSPDGAPIRSGINLTARFDTPPGSASLPSGDYRLDAECPNGAPGWQLLVP